MDGGKSSAELFRTKLRGLQWCSGGFSEGSSDGAPTARLEDAHIERKCNVLRGKVVPLLAAHDDEPGSSSSSRGSAHGSAGTAFVQMSLPLSNALPGEFAAEGAGTVDASQWAGVAATVFCPRREAYSVQLRTPSCAAAHPLSAYRAAFATEALQFTEVRLPWAAFEGHGPGASEVPLDPRELRRLGFLAFGRAFDAELAVAEVRFYRADEDGECVLAP
jgi:hypothetical protein